MGRSEGRDISNEGHKQNVRPKYRVTKYKLDFIQWKLFEKIILYVGKLLDDLNLHLRPKIIDGILRTY